MKRALIAFSAVAASVVATAALTATIPTFTGPADPANVFQYLNQMIGYVNAGYLTPGINYIDNAEFAVYQRGTTAKTGITTTATYHADRWAGYTLNGAGSETLTRVTSGLPNGFGAAERVQRAAANADTHDHCIVQEISSVNSVFLNGQATNLTFFAKADANYSAANSLLKVAVPTGTTADEGIATMISGWAGAANAYNSTVTLTTSWQQFSVPAIQIIPGVNEIAVTFCFTPVGTAGTTDGFEITGVYFGPGAVPVTTFPHRMIGEEMPRLVRYFYQFNEPASTVRQAIGENTTTTNARFYVPFPLPMRSTPATITATVGTYAAAKSDGTAQTCTGLAAVSSSADTNGVSIDCTVAANLVAGNATMLIGAGGTGLISASADF